MTLSQLLERRDAILAELDDTELPPERVAELTTEADEVVESIEAARNAEQSRTDTRAKLLQAQVPPASTPSAPRIAAEPQREERSEAPASLGEVSRRFFESPQYTEFRSRGFSGQTNLDMGLDIRATIDSSATSGGAFQNPARPNDVAFTNMSRTPRVIDLVDRRTTNSGTVEYVRDTSAAAPGAAAEVAEAGAKPEATITLEVVTDSVRTIAEWVNITRQAADDADQVRAHVERLLQHHVLVRLDSQIINGNGTAPNIRGILNTSGINTEAPGAAEARIITIRKAMTDVEVAEFAPDGVVLHPLDWEKVELSTDSNGMFRVSPNVQNAMSPRIWGLTVVSTTAIASGTGLVGAFRIGAILWMRDEVRLLVTDSHASNFTSNILTLLAELRAALSVPFPKAFSAITFNGTT
jgi:HK97 family phage major capsid protein